MKKTLGIILIIFIILQFFPLERTPTAIDPKTDFLTLNQPSINTGRMIINACYDCHSTQTKYPWYSQIAPISWYVENHIEEGKSHLNFSTFAHYSTRKQKHKIEECIEVIEKNEMPLSSYSFLHSKADLSPAQKQELIQYFKAVLAKNHLETITK